jgi:Na+/H+ antiporter NhaD/arsenite permease-like protein
LDNVTVVVLIAPVILYVARTLDVNPIPFLIAGVMASNVGGAATLIGDPPNILIGSAADIDFLNFLINMGPPTIIALIAGLSVSLFQFNRQLHVPADRRNAVMRLTTKGLINDGVMLTKSLIVLAMVLVGFFLHAWLHLEPATIALSGATLLLIWTRYDPAEVLENIEWTTLMFFVGLFITVQAIVEVGIIAELADTLILLTAGNLNITAYFLLWFSALASGVVDNIPYTATMIPVVEGLKDTLPLEPLWWALALGADFGGNLTLVGASANVVVASISERSGHRLGFIEFLRYGTIYVAVTLLIATAWLSWRYL